MGTLSAFEEETRNVLAAVPDAEALVADLQRKLEGRGIFFGDTLLPTYPWAVILDGARFDELVSDAEKLNAIIERLVARSLAEPGIWRELGFDAAAAELFRIDPGYRRSVVISRPDTMITERGLRFLELNADSPAMMAFADEIEAALLELPPFAGFAARLRLDRRVEALHTELRACYAEYGGTGAPTIAVLDWPGERTAHEHRKIAARFTELGSPSFVTYPAQLSYGDRRLSAGGRPIDLVYRRVLCRDFVAGRPELAPLVRAYRDGTVCMVNPLRSYIVGTKALFAFLQSDDNRADLSAEERAFVDRVIPTTRMLRPNDELLKDEWVLKRVEGSGGEGVLLGPETSPDAWREAIASSKTTAWVRQRLEPVTSCVVPEARGKEFTFTSKFTNFNPFLFGGRHAGSMTRVSASPVINICLGGGLLPTIRAA